MRSLDVTFKANEGDTEAFRVVVERQVPAGWVGDADSTMYFTQGAAQTLLLEEGQRIVIEPWGATVEMVFDKEQNAVMPRTAFESRPSEEEKQEMERKRQQELRDIQAGKNRIDLVSERAATQARDKAIQDQIELDKVKAERKAKQEADTKAPQTPVASPSPQPTPAPTPNKGGMGAPGPSTGGQSSADVKK